MSTELHDMRTLTLIHYSCILQDRTLCAAFVRCEERETNCAVAQTWGIKLQVTYLSSTVSVCGGVRGVVSFHWCCLVTLHKQ